MDVRFKQKYIRLVRAGFEGLGHWWQSNPLNTGLTNLWLVIKGNGSIFLGTGLFRTLVEALLISSLFFISAANNVVISDYRLITLVFLPAGLVATGWSALRLQKVVPPKLKGWGRVGRLLVLTPAFGLLLGLLLVADCLLISLFYYPVQNLAAPALPSLFNLDATIAPQAKFVFSIFGIIIAGPDQFSSTTPTPVIVGVRLLIFALEVTLAFVVARTAVGLLAIPGGWLKRLAARRLLWQLTLSHFGVVLASFATAVACVILFIFPPSIYNRVPGVPASELPAYEARTLADSIARTQLVSGPVSTADLNSFLTFLTNNTINKNTSNIPLVNNLSNRVQQLVRGLQISGDTTLTLGNIAVTNSSGQVIASNNVSQFGPEVGGVTPTVKQPELQALVARSATGETDLSRLTVGKVQPAVLLAGAYPIKDRQGAVQSVVLVVEQPTIAFVNSSRLLLVLVVGSVFLLVAAFFISFFTLIVAFVFGYFLSKKLARKLETLAAAADALAIGNLDQRVQLTDQDEVGRLVSRFNLMAQRLQESQTNLEQEKQVAEQALQTKRDLVANVSHELRTPVSTIRAHVDWLLSVATETQPLEAEADTNSRVTLVQADDTELYQYLEIIGREAERLSAIIEDLLDLSQVEARRIKVELGAVSVAEVAQEIKQALGLMAQRERKITLILDLAPDLQPVWADRNRLTQILTNLTRNSINYTPAGGLVSIGAMMDGPHKVAVWVADTGMGIPTADLNRVFERFYRTDASRSRNTGGAGLGLAIVKALVEAMGGTITVESVENEGSKFTVILPTVEQTT